MPATLKPWIFIALCLVLLLACRPQAPVQEPRTVIDVPANGQEGGALSGGAEAPAVQETDYLAGTQWPAAELVSGEASLSCGQAPAIEPGAIETQAIEPAGLDPAPVVEATAPIEAIDAPGVPLKDLSFALLEQAVGACEGDRLRLQYKGKIAADFTTLVERVANMATRKRIDQRVLDIDSAGGHVEDAMKAGDAIAASQWTVRVGEDANCHSACVLILAAGDQRDIEGRVGVHRMLRIGSEATTRAELTQELREVYGDIKEYLERNGAAVTVADLMMTVPNRKLRLLTRNELMEYGLEGPNAVQDDLERIQLTRKCGDDFVRRKDDYDRAFTRQCAGLEQDLEAMQTCGLQLLQGFGFPDRKCPVESPLSQLEATAVTTGQAGTE